MTMATTTAEISVAAQRAIRSAAAELAPYAAEPRVAALVTKLGAIASPVDADQDRLDRLSKALGDCTQIAKSEESSAGLRERASTTRGQLETAYLEMVSPSSAAVRKRDREHLGAA
jgi:hypothetical protein